MDNWLKNPWAIRFISLVLAILLYISVSISETPDAEDRTFSSSGTNATERITNVPVEILMDEENDYVVSGVPEVVTIGLDGPNAAVTPIIRNSAIDVYADLEGYEPGTYEIELEHSEVSENIDVNIEPSTVEVTIEQRASAERTVEVDYINESQIAPGFEIGETTVEPETVTVESSESEVEKVATVKAFVNMEGAEESIIAREAPVNVYDSEGNELNVRIEPETVSVSVELENPSKKVPIEINTTGELPEEMALDTITAEPANVTVFASEETLDGISQIATEPIDLSKVTESTEMEVALEVPSEITSIDQEQVTIKIELAETSSSTFEDVEIETQNLAEDRTASFIEAGSDFMNVTVFGKDEELKGLTTDDVRLSVDLAEAVTGEQKIAVKASVTGNLMTELEHELVTMLVE